MNTTSKVRLLNILLADDGTPNMGPAIDLLSELPHNKECQITSLRVFTPIEGSEFSRVEVETEKTNELLKSRNFKFRSEVIPGYPGETILQYASEHNPNLVVLGSKSTGYLGGFLGNVASEIIHSAKWPVLIVRGINKGIKKVLVVTDGSKCSQYTCEYFGGFPLPAGTNLYIMHVVIPVRVTYPIEPAGLALPAISAEDEVRLNQENTLRGQEYLEIALHQLGNPSNTKLILKTGEPIDQILSYIKSEQIDLLVCGSRGTGNLAGWILGSISRELVQQAPCSVLVVRSSTSNI